MFWSSRIHEKVRFLKKDHQNGKRPVSSPIVPRKAERTTSALLCKRAHFCAKARTSEKCAFSTLSFHQLQTESSTFLTNVRYFCNEQFLPKRAQKKTSRKECSLEASGIYIYLESPSNDFYSKKQFEIYPPFLKWSKRMAKKGHTKRVVLISSWVATRNTV